MDVDGVVLPCIVNGALFVAWLTTPIEDVRDKGECEVKQFGFLQSRLVFRGGEGSMQGRATLFKGLVRLSFQHSQSILYPRGRIQVLNILSLHADQCVHFRTRRGSKEGRLPSLVERSSLSTFPTTASIQKPNPPPPLGHVIYV